MNRTRRCAPPSGLEHKPEFLIGVRSPRPPTCCILIGPRAQEPRPAAPRYSSLLADGVWDLDNCRLLIEPGRSIESGWAEDARTAMLGKGSCFGCLPGPSQSVDSTGIPCLGFTPTLLPSPGLVEQDFCRHPIAIRIDGGSKDQKRFPVLNYHVDWRTNLGERPLSFAGCAVPALSWDRLQNVLNQRL